MSRLESDTYLAVHRAPQWRRERCTERGELVASDEIQKLEQLLVDVQLLIEEREPRFVLTNSGAPHDGLLPAIDLGAEPDQDLAVYVGVYLRGQVIEPRLWRQRTDFEVDDVGGGAVEARASANVTSRQFAGFAALNEESRFARCILVCQQPRPRTVDGIELVPWREFADERWSDRLVRG